MHVLTEDETDDKRDCGAIEELALPAHLLSWLSEEARAANPHMPDAFGVPAMIRLLIDQINESGVDLSVAECEADIVRLVTDAVRRRRNSAAATEQLSSSGCSESRRSNRSSPPARGRFRSGRRPRSGRG